MALLGVILLPAPLAQPVSDALSLLRAHIAKSIAHLLTAFRRELVETPEIIPNPLAVLCGQALKNPVPLPNVRSLLVRKTAPLLESLLCRKPIDSRHFSPAGSAGYQALLARRIQRVPACFELAQNVLLLLIQTIPVNCFILGKNTIAQQE